jgi:hypothetical protein
MTFAVRKLQGIGLIMLLTLAALIAYPVTLKVSATRAELRTVERQIAEARHRNRMLEGDIAVLANAQQLDRWNREYFGYTAPGAGQYLQGERALASLDGLRPPRGGVSAPVLVAMADTGGDAGAAPRAHASGSASAVRARMTDVALSDIASAAAPQISQSASVSIAQ